LSSLITGLRDNLYNQQIRFFGFTDEWRKFKVTELLDFFTTNSLSWDSLEYEDGKLLNLHYGLIHKGLETIIDLVEYKLPSIKAQHIPFKYERCKEGDVIFADASEDLNDIGKVVEFTDCKELNIISGLHTIHGRDKLDQTIPGFKGYAFSSKSFRTQIKQLAQGTKVYSLSTKNFKDCFINIPTKEEQKSIVNALQCLNKKIRVERKLLTKFQLQKNSLSNKLFI